MTKSAELYGGNMEFTQECDETNNIQSLKIEICEAGAGKYMVIKTERWAFDNINELVLLLQKVETAFEMERKQ